MKSAILQSLASGVAVIDRSGRVLQVNHCWRVFARTSDWMDGHAGGNLLERCAAAFDDGNQMAGDVVAGVSSVLDGSRKWFTIEHRTDAGSSAEWWTVSAVPLNRPEGGAGPDPRQHHRSAPGGAGSPAQSTRSSPTCRESPPSAR